MNSVNNNSPTPKAYFIVDYPESFMNKFKYGEDTLVNRHITWIKTQEGYSKIGTEALFALELFVLSLSLIGIPLVCKMVDQANRVEKQQKVEAFYQMAATKTAPTDDDAGLPLKSKTHTSNYTHDFVIKDEVIWFKRKNDEKAQWAPLYFDGYDAGEIREIPVEIDSDGANLIVLDQNHCVHYKKIIREARGEVDILQRGKKAKELFIASQGEENWKKVDLIKNTHIVFDKVAKNNWKEKWFSLPYANVIMNLFTGKKLQLPEGIKAWAISHRGRYNNYLEDTLDQKHYVEAGVTTLYTLDENGRDILKYDPWSPKHVKVAICVPESADTSYEAVNLSASASHLMTVGYERKKGESTETLKIYTRLADVDSEGWNPGLKYDYFSPEEKHDEYFKEDGTLQEFPRLFPLEDWRAHDLIDENGQPIQQVSKQITIVQTGEGNEEREIRIAGLKEGVSGYYYKHLKEKTNFWHFKEDSRIDVSDILPTQKNSDTNFETTVHNYEIKNGSFSQAKILSAELNNFGQRSYHSDLSITVLNKSNELMPLNLKIHKKKTLLNFIGFKGDAYDLVVPQDYHQNDRVMSLFGNKKILPLKVSEENGIVKLSCPVFELSF